MANNDPKKAPPSSDERKLVDSGQIDLDDIEGQLTLLWERNRATILYGLLAGIAVFLAFHGYRYLRESANLRAQADYAASADEQAKLAFAEGESGRPLGGFAFKELADAAFAKGEFADAERYYRSAVETTHSAVRDAAQLGLAMSLSFQAKTEDAKAALREIAEDPEAPSQAEALYRLAVIASEAGDVEAARELAGKIDEGDYYWKSMAEALPGVDANS